MSSGRPDSWFRTLRFRLTFWNTVALFLLVLATLLGLREGLRFTLQREMDALLAAAVEEVRLLLPGLALLVLCPLLGYWLAARVIRPLATIVDTAAHLQPGNLAARLPVAGSGDELDRLAVTLNGLLDRLAQHLDRQRAFVANA